jgi:hypothetical protein
MGSSVLDSSRSYTQLLRPVGQALESLRMESFSLTIEGDFVSVQGRKRREQPVEKLFPRGFWQLFRSPPQELDAWESIELRYTPDQLSLMDDEGRTKRGTRGKPDAHSLSQIIRAVGAIVDQKQGRLISVRKDGQKIEIQYESALEHRVNEEFTASSLYDYWVRMYLKRSNRVEPDK